MHVQQVRSDGVKVIISCKRDIPSEVLFLLCGLAFPVWPVARSCGAMHEIVSHKTLEAANCHFFCIFCGIVASSECLSVLRLPQKASSPDIDAMRSTNGGCGDQVQPRGLPASLHSFYETRSLDGRRLGRMRRYVPDTAICTLCGIVVLSRAV